MNLIAASISGVVVLAAVWRQFQIWEQTFSSSDKSAQRAFFAYGVPVLTSILIVVGIIATGIHSLLDEKNTAFTIGTMGMFVLKGIVLIGVTIIKSFLSLLIAGYVVSYEIYTYATYQEFRSVPLIGAILDWIFSFGPSWLSNGWLGLQVSWALITATLFDW